MKEAELLRGLVVESGLKPKEILLQNTEFDREDIIGGYETVTIKSCYDPETKESSLVALIWNSDGKEENLPTNRAIREKEHPFRPYDIIYGNLLILGIKSDYTGSFLLNRDFRSLTDEEFKAFYSRFEYPEAFFSKGNGTWGVVRLTDDILKEMEREEER